MVPSITAEILRQWQQKNQPFALLDVREEPEHAHYNIGGKLIPMNEVLKRVSELPTDLPVVVYCQKGIRSAIVIQRLQQKFGCFNLYNLQGGMVAWQRMMGNASY